MNPNNRLAYGAGVRLWAITGLSFLVFFLFLLILSFIYKAALPGYFLFDDTPNLGGLELVIDFASFIAFITSGDAGPLGRPLALASFALQSSAWPHDPASFLRVNLAIHVANTALVFLLAGGLARLREAHHGQGAFWIGVFTAALWGASPFLANTSLMVVQRMTSLSALFVFAGLAAFVWAHIPRSQATFLKHFLFAVFAICIPLAAFSKENGVLLPLLAATILLLWMPKGTALQGMQFRLFYLGLILLPSAAVLLYLAYRTPQILAAGYGPDRYFTPEQRLLSQPWILLDYLRNLLLPSSVSASPFYDHWPAPKGILAPPAVAIALAIWAVLIGFAIKLHQRAQWLTFGLFFFVAGHVIESSIFGLELHFAHRNYVPAFGVYFAITWAVFSVPERYRKLAFGGLGAYALSFILILGQVTSGWNDTFVNAILWQERNPVSERATQFLVQHYVAMGSSEGARAALDSLVEANPDLARSQIMRTRFCAGREDDFPVLLDEVTARLKSIRRDGHATLELVKAADDEQYRNAHCEKRDIAAIGRMGRALLDNPLYGNHPSTRSHILFVLSVEQNEVGSLYKAVDWAVESFRTWPNLDIGLFAAGLMVAAGDRQQWDLFVDEMRKTAPEAVHERKEWLERIESYRQGALGVANGS